MQFTLTEFKEEFQTHGVNLTLADPEHQEMNGQFEVTLMTSSTIVHSLMVHVIVLEAYIHFALMYTTYHIFPVLQIKYLINKDRDPNKLFKIVTGTKPSVSHLRVLFCLCVEQKATAHDENKALNIRHQAQKGFRGIFVGIPQHQKGYLVYVQSTRKIIYSYDVVFDEKNSSALAYTSQTYYKAMNLRPVVAYTPNS